MTEEHLYTYNAMILKIVDADTLDLAIDLGCNVLIKERCRLYGINAPEMRTAEGKAAKAYLETLICVGDGVLIKTLKDKKGKYGRYLVTVCYGSTTINDKLVAEGHAVEYMK